MTINQSDHNAGDPLQNQIVEIRKRIRVAAEMSGRNESDISLMAVTKAVPVDRVNCALQAGIDLIGENRVQEFLSKFPSYQTNQEQIHFIGHLQKNKVKKILDKVSMIESVDSISLAEEINRVAKMQNKKMPILLEVNIGREETKFGFLSEQIIPALEHLSEFPNIKVVGLMVIPPKNTGNYYFKKMQQLYLDISGKNMDNIDMSYLSMGMSEDYQIAIECGANIVRVGTAIFGKR